MDNTINIGGINRNRIITHSDCFFVAQYNSKFIIKTIIKTHIYNNYYNMKKVVFIGNGDMYRSKFAEAYFNNLGKLECLFMLNTHGMGRYPSSRYPAAYSSNIDLKKDVELNEFSKQVCESYLMYGKDCYTKEHTKISDKDFAFCDKIIVVSEKEQKDFMMKHYNKYADKMEFWQIKEVKGDSKVKKKIAKKIKEMVKKLYIELTKK